jgi:hypothetical protein
MEGPPVDHNDGVFRNEVVPIPVVFCVEMILSKFVDRPPAKDFLLLSIA